MLNDARHHFSSGLAVFCALGLGCVGSSADPPTETQAIGALSSALPSEAVFPGRRATEAEVRAFASRVNHGIAPPIATQADLEAVYPDVASDDAETRHRAVARFHNIMRSLPSAEARKAAGERMAAIAAARTGDPRRQKP